MYLYLLIMSSIGRLPIEIRYYQQVYILIISVNGGHGQQIGIDIGNNGFIVISWDNFVMCNL